MTEPNPPDLTSHPHVGQEPLRTGNPPETQADREDVAFGPPTDAEGRLSGGYLAVILLTVVACLGIAVLGMLWGGVRWW